MNNNKMDVEKYRMGMLISKGRCIAAYFEIVA
jgi:hypothetical protein